MLFNHSVKTGRRNELVDVTSMVADRIRESKVKSGICVVYVPHTTAAITINENADPSVKADILSQLEKLVPHGAGYSHMEGNADSHIKASMIGPSVHLIIEDGKPVLGTWQGIFFCEFDGPRNRRLYIKIIPDR
jgi:secondary thiamine-phosphate synthase enzyme